MNRPDLFYINKTDNTGIIYEIGITTAKDIEIRQKEKADKYEELATELAAIHKLERIQRRTIILTWDGLVTKTTSKNLKELGISKQSQAYMVSRVMKMTNDTIMNSAREDEEM